MAKGNQHSAQSTQARERECQAVELRKAGLSYRAIGKALKVSDVAALKMVRRAIERLEELTKEEASEVRRIETERLDAMFAAVWPKAEKGELDAIATVLRIQSRRAELWGLDAPKKQEHSGLVVVNLNWSEMYGRPAVTPSQRVEQTIRGIANGKNGAH